jgi:hypothetical protein
MKSFLTILLLTLFTGLYSQESELIGTWNLERHVVDSGYPCTDENKMTYTFMSDHTYTLDVNGYKTTGRWVIMGTTIYYYDSKLQNPADGSVGNHAYEYNISKNGELIQQDYVCSELGGTSYYKKQVSTTIMR